MPDHSAELALLGCVLLNAVVFGAAWRFAARRMTASRTQALCDAALLWYAVQYVAIGLPGVVGLLQPTVVVTVALALAAVLFAVSVRGLPLPTPASEGTPDDPGLRAHPRTPAWIGTATRFSNRVTAVGLGLFAALVAVGFAWNQSALPVFSNDALTYHFPAAAQWLQRGRIEVFPTWFFNPANGYSPLAGSTFIAWLMVPFGSDVIARFVQVPALLCVGLAVYRLGRQLTTGPLAAAAVAAAAVLCRPFLMASLMGKDDLFVAFTFIAAVVALAPTRSAEPVGPLRLGLAMGLLLATKYTVLLAVPLLALAIDGPVRAGWRLRKWLAAATVAGALALPWYVRNAIAAGDPVFSIDLSVAGVHLLHGLATMTRSTAFASAAADAGIVLGGSYGLPIPVAVAAGLAWLVTVVAQPQRLWTDPLLRACVLGPPLGITLFLWRSPFPEVRFLFPALLLLLATVAAATARARWCSLALPAAAVATLSVAGGWAVFGWLVPAAAAIAAAIAWADWATRHGPRWRRAAGMAIPVVGLAAAAYVGWASYCHDYPDQWTADTSAWSLRYAEFPLWQFVNQHVPADAAVAYADLYLVYPLQGPTLRRRLAYAPTRRGVRTPADLPWLGRDLSGEQLVTAAAAATAAVPDPVAWRANLRALGAQYLVVGHALPGNAPVEAAWAKGDPHHFRPMFTAPSGWVFAISLER